MKNKFFSGLFLGLVSVFSVYSQQTSISPYSNIGIGERRDDDNVIISSMGGLGSAYISEVGNEINFINPAANRNLSYSVYNIGVNNDFSFQKQKGMGTKDRSMTYFSNVAIGFPISEKIKMGVELKPYTSIGYDILSEYDKNGLTQSQYLKGRGGINIFNGMLSYNITKEFSLGTRIGYAFGDVKREQELKTNESQLYSGIENKLSYNHVDFLLGASYHKKLTKGYNLSVGATYGFGRKVDTDVSYISSTYTYIGDNYKDNIDTIRYSKYTGKSKLPSSFSIGAMFGKDEKWGAGFDFRYSNQSDFSIPENTTSYDNQFRIGVGGWIIPNKSSFRSYLNRTTYRYGLFYEDLGIEINNKKLNQYGLTAGVGLPLGKSTKPNLPSLNFGIQAGQRGTTSNNLVKENFLKFNISLLLNDLWFKKRQFQ